MSTIWIEETIERMERLSLEQQQQIVEFIRNLKPTPPGISGKDLLKFAGLIPKEDLEEMKRAIEEGYE